MFRDIDPARLKLLAFTSERVQFADGQRFFSQGDAADAAYVILEGKADVLLNTPAAKSRSPSSARTRSSARWASSPTARARPPSSRRQPTTALRIDKRVFLELLTQFPQMSLAVMRELATRLEKMNTQLARQSRS